MKQIHSRRRGRSLGPAGAGRYGKPAAARLFGEGLIGRREAAMAAEDNALAARRSVRDGINRLYWQKTPFGRCHVVFNVTLFPDPREVTAAAPAAPRQWAKRGVMARHPDRRRRRLPPAKSPVMMIQDWGIRHFRPARWKKRSCFCAPRRTSTRCSRYLPKERDARRMRSRPSRDQASPGPAHSLHDRQCYHRTR